MEKEAGIPKPGDLFIGVIDVFAVLIPGIIAAALLVKGLNTPLRTDIIFVSGLVIAGWVLGHVLHGIGSFLDPLLYDPLFKPRDTVPADQATILKSNRFRLAVHGYLHKTDNIYLLAKEMTDVPEWQNQQHAGAGVPEGMYQWARTWLDSHSPDATAQIDRIEADSKLFRSLAVLCLIAVPALMKFHKKWELSAHHPLALTVVALAGLVFSLWRYCDLRNKMIRRCYLHYVQLRFEARAGSPRSLTDTLG
jgi:hypothetical protein